MAEIRFPKIEIEPADLDRLENIVERFEDAIFTTNFWEMIMTTDRGIARKLRLAMITNVYLRGFITESDARELLSGPLSPNDPDTIIDDSRLFLEQDALTMIDAEEKE